MSRQFHNVKTMASLKENVVAVWSADLKQPHRITPDLLVPDGYIQLVFILSGSYKRRKLSANHDSFVLNQSVIIGIQDKVILSQNIGELKSIGLQFDPLQFYLLFGDLGVMARNTHKPISRSKQSELLKLNETISKAGSTLEALQVIETFFVNYQPKIKGCEPWHLTKNSLACIRNKKGSTSIEKIAKSINTNARTLYTHFNDFIGFGPEEMIEIIKTNSTYSEPSINESSSSLSIKNLFEDMKESKKG